jgi:valyl-tRNA synthetase
MALNAASHNVTGDKTGPMTSAPPAPSDESKNAILGSANSEATGQSAPGRDGGEKDVGKKVKSEKELEKERKKAEKDAKFKAKKAAQASSGGAADDKAPAKEKRKPKAEKEVLPDYVDETKPGEKKILKSLDDPFHKAYIPKVVESAWYEWWEKQGYFKPELQDGKVKPAGNFVIPIPPPNITGKLHCGHALATSLQDLLIRWKRMSGFSTLFLPGCDHASISTQSVIENMLWRREKKTRHDLGRPKFLETTMEWKHDMHQSITNSLKRMGGSFDWSREAFTMDENLSAAVTETFVRMHEEGFIYRSNRLVNWCTQLNTSISNLEVDNKELTGRTLLDVPGYERKVEFGVLTHFKYPIDGTEEFIEVATTRPETMLGDVAIAVHPKDERYKHLVGKKAKHPFVDRLMSIVADDYVDPEFGTGAVKITPAHDANDFALGQRHSLEQINILTDNGLMNHNTGQFEGMKRFDVRYKVTEELEKLGLFVKKEDNAMKVPLCNKSKDVIEPLMKPQWWMKMKPLAEQAIKVVKDGDLIIRPATSEKMYYIWLENINDWCLSR